MSFDLKIISGDVSIANGDLATIYNTDKLVQDVLKICVTDLGSNPFHSWYGSVLSQSTIGSTLDFNIVMSLAKMQTEDALNNLKKIQSSQLRSFQNVTPSEQISYIRDISIARSARDFRLYRIDIALVSKGLDQVTTSFNITTI